MNAFRFHRELDIPYLQSRFGHDAFTAREVIGSFVEMAEHDLLLLEVARDQKRYSAFARVAGRMKKGMEMVGLSSEISHVDVLRNQLASTGVDNSLEQLADELLDMIRDKSSLLRIEVQRLDKHIEAAAY